MIIVRLSGGLGNQMFQYALARSLKDVTGYDISIDPLFLTTSQTGLVKRDYGLHVFNITLPITTKKDAQGMILPQYDAKDLYSRVLRRLYLFVDKFLPYKHKKYLQDSHAQKFDPRVFTKADNSYLIGNWASPLFFENIRPIILQEFSLKNPYTEGSNQVLRQIKNTPVSICIHVRRGDHVTMYSNKLAAAGMEYYEAAMNLMDAKLSGKSCVYFVFSDDMQYVKEHFKGSRNFVFVEHDELPDYERLVLMSECTHNIMSISSFAFWGAWLNQNPNKIVIAPKKLRNDGQDATDYIPSNLGWIQL